MGFIVVGLCGCVWVCGGWGGVVMGWGDGRVEFFVRLDGMFLQVKCGFEWRWGF